MASDSANLKCDDCKRTIGYLKTDKVSKCPRCQRKPAVKKTTNTKKKK